MFSQKSGNKKKIGVSYLAVFERGKNMAVNILAAKGISSVTAVVCKLLHRPFSQSRKWDLLQMYANRDNRGLSLLRKFMNRLWDVVYLSTAAAKSQPGIVLAIDDVKCCKADSNLS